MNMFRSSKKSIKKTLPEGLKFSLNNRKPALEKPGSEQSGEWLISIEKLNEASVCYSAGTGENFSFALDTALAKSFNCAESIFDPARGSKKHFEPEIEAPETRGLFSVTNSNESYDI
jgi:hypothetical protein